ncbi:MAG: hypothetical protein K6E27_03505 [Eubacterium sp.]|nr:hypothetical protein [Eubacterium sp.]
MDCMLGVKVVGTFSLEALYLTTAYLARVFWTITGLFSLLRYKQGKWTTIKLVEKAA